MQADWLGDDPAMESDMEDNDFAVHIGKLTEEVTQWANQTFPHRTDVSMYLKLYSEIGEMIESDGDPMEIADVFIMLLDYAHRKQVDITSIVRKKLDINRNREWTTDRNGVNRHVG